MNAAFRAIVIGGTGQVGGAVVQELLATPACRQLVMVTRKPVESTDDPRLRTVVMDTGAADFASQVADLAKIVVASGDHVAGVSCVGVGSGSLNWSEEQLKQLEIGVVGGFANGARQSGITQFCLLSAIGANAASRIKYVRVMGLKEQTIQSMHFPRLAIFRPGIIVGNAHTPRWTSCLGTLVPGSLGNIDQRDIGRAFVAEIARHATEAGLIFYNNEGMRRLFDHGRDTPKNRY